LKACPIPNNALSLALTFLPKKKTKISKKWLAITIIFVGFEFLIPHV
jgi:hypothetical protein